MEEKLIAGLKQEYQDRVEMMYELYAHKGILIRKLDLHTKKWSYTQAPTASDSDFNEFLENLISLAIIYIVGIVIVRTLSNLRILSTKKV